MSLKSVLSLLVCLCAVTLLTACGASRSPVKTEIVEVERTRVVRLDPALTAPCRLPPLPVGNGEPVTVQAYLDWIEETLVVVNEDGGCSWRFARIREMQDALAPAKP